VSEECLTLTAYFAERDRVHGRLLADELLDLYAEHDLLASILVRGVEGFSSRRELHTERLLTLSEDLPLVAVAVDTRERIQAVLPRAAELCSAGLVTLERGAMLTEALDDPGSSTTTPEANKITLILGRGEHTGGRPASHAVIDVLHRSGIDGATAFLGIDGTAHRVRRRARFFARNEQVPVTVVGVGAADTVATVVPHVARLLERPLVLLERVRVCKVAGIPVAPAGVPPEVDASGPPVLQKLMVHAPEDARHEGRPLYVELISRLRSAGAAGATALRGFWGFQGEHEPHGDALFAPRRRVPVVVTVIDTPERAQRWFSIIDEVTADSGLVTSEFLSGAPGVSAMSDGGRT
jgi:PII-like signaling protein